MSFQDIKGQDKPIEMLKDYLRSSTLAGAYLFIGPEGIGKHLVAKTFAKAINCAEKKDDSCDACPACLKINKGQHPDVHFIEAVNSDVIKIEYIRELKKNINLKPYEGKRNIFIINDAHKLNAESANALLKVLEEPPGESLIILITAKPALLFKTIVSRCQILKFSPLPRTALEKILKKDYAQDNNLAHFLAYFCEGRMGEALRLKDEDILKEKNKVIDVLALSRIFDLKDLSLEDKKDVRSHINIVASWFRDIYLIKIGMPDCELINLDRKEELLNLMRHYRWSKLSEIMNSISDSLLYLQENINVKLLLANLRTELCQVNSS